MSKVELGDDLVRYVENRIHEIFSDVAVFIRDGKIQTSHEDPGGALIWADMNLQSAWQQFIESDGQGLREMP